MFDNIKQGEYTIRIGNSQVVVNVIRMEACLFLWIGTTFNTSFHNLSVSINRVDDNPSSTVLLNGIDNNDISERLSRVLSKKFNQMVYVSCSLSMSELEETSLRSTLLERVAQFIS